MLGVLITSALKTEIEDIAEREDRSLSSVGYLLLLKGLDAYQKDNDLRSPRNLPLRKGRKGGGKRNENE
jgi:hypothetical protein